jgi:nucleotide-binding universal stress UspA family protein
MTADLNPETRQRIDMFEAAIAAYVLESLNPHQQPELCYEAAKHTLLVFSHLRGEIPLVTGNSLLTAIDPAAPSREIPAAVPHDPEAVYDVVARTYLPHLQGKDVLSYCRGLASSMRSFWPTLNAEKLAEKMTAAAEELGDRPPV